MLTPDFKTAATAGLVAFALAAMMAWRFSKPESLLHILDHPNERSLHQIPTPRSGGIAIVSAIMAAGFGMLLLWPARAPELAWLAAATLLIATTSFIEDRFELPVLARVSVHFGCASLLAW